MSAALIRGWCPGALRPMLAGDGLVVRLRPRGGRLTAVQAGGIAALAKRYGNGLIDLSTRANLQLRGVRETTHAPLRDGLSALGLVDATTAAESRRNIVVTPFWGDGDGTPEIVAALTAALAGSESPQTPAKFGYAVDTARPSVLHATSADIRIEWHHAGYLVRGDSFVTGAVVETADQAAQAASDLAHWFVAQGGIGPDGRGRMARLLPDMPFKARHALLPDRFKAGGALSDHEPEPVPGPHPLGALVAFEFGQMRAETLSVLAEFGSIRVTPWRMLLIEGAARLPAIAGVIADPADPLLRVIACTGAPGCPQALVVTRPLARALCSSLAPGTRLHVSGCAKGCAHPGKAPLTLVGGTGGTVDLIRDGRAKDRPAVTGLAPASLMANPALLTKAKNAP